MRVAGPTVLLAACLAGCAAGQNADTGSAPAPQGEPERIYAPHQSDTAAEREHAVEQLLGRWVYEVCDEGGNCETVVRVYEEAPESGLVRYTELYNGTANEGFVDYDLESDGFVEFDYPQDWGSYEFEQRYMSEDESIRLFGETPFGGPEDRTLQWRIDDDGQQMILRTGIGDITEEPGEFLDVIFSRVPVIGDGEEDN